MTKEELKNRIIKLEKKIEKLNKENNILRNQLNDIFTYCKEIYGDLSNI